MSSIYGERYCSRCGRRSGKMVRRPKISLLQALIPIWNFYYTWKIILDLIDYATDWSGGP